MKIVRTHINLEGSSVSMHLKFPKALLSVINLFKRLIQLALFILVMNVFAYWTHQHFIDTAQEQRIHLYSRLEGLNTKIDSLNTKVSESYKNEYLLYTKYGLAVPDIAVRKMGSGGPLFPDSALVWSAIPIRKLKNNVSDGLRRIEKEIDQTNSSYLKLQSHIISLHGSLLHTPSVWPAYGFLSSPFGYRTHPITGGKTMHPGVDISAPQWTPVRSSANGKVETVASSETLGKYVSIDHGNGIVTRYGHMVMPFVKEGQMVSRFDIIGYIGDTGRATGHHLHYEVWVNGVAMNPIHYILPDQYSVE